MSTGTENQHLALGIVLIVATALVISLQDVAFKLFSGHLTLWQIFALRGLFTIPALVVIALLRRQRKTSLVATCTLWPVLRGICLTMTFVAFYAAIPFLNLSTVGAANYMAPIFVALLSAYVIGEPVSRQGWIGVCLGFVGVVVLLQPGTDVFSAFALLPLFGAGFYACGHVITRTKCQNVPAGVLALSLNTVMCLAGFLISALLFLWAPVGGVAEAYPYIFGGWAV